jgi:hypothetical protein
MKHKPEKKHHVMMLEKEKGKKKTQYAPDEFLSVLE